MENMKHILYIKRPFLNLHMLFIKNKTQNHHFFPKVAFDTSILHTNFHLFWYNVSTIYNGKILVKSTIQWNLVCSQALQVAQLLPLPNSRTISLTVYPMFITSPFPSVQANMSLPSLSVDSLTLGVFYMNRIIQQVTPMLASLG